MAPSSGTADDLAGLLVRTAAGDRSAFRLVYEATSAKLYGTILIILTNREESEDVLQEAYVKIWKKAGSYDRSRGRPMTWLITIARNRAIDRFRNRPRVQLIDIDEFLDVSDPLPLADIVSFAARDTQRLVVALAKLPPRVATAIRGVYFDGASSDQLAICEGVPVSTLKSWIRRGLIQLRADLALSPVLA